MAGLPRKYARMGFKRGWKAFRASRSSATRAKVSYMAKKKRRSSFRGFSRKARRVARSSGAIDLYTIGGAMAYGAVRSDIDRMVTPKVASYLPNSAAPYASNIVLGGLAYLGSKKTSGMLQKVSKAALIVEAANAGAKLRGGVTTTTSSGAPTQGAYNW